MDPISEFLARYRKEYDFYAQCARLAAQLIDQRIQGAGIRAIVTSRAKSPTRLEEKIRKRSSEKKYKTSDDIFKDIVDLAGVRIALYFPGEREQVQKSIEEIFTWDVPPKEFGKTPPKPNPTYARRFQGYAAVHYRARIKDGHLNSAEKRYGDALIEIQVASVLMHAWAEVEHDLVYKPMQGSLSAEEYAILDEINGLVLSGEIALERLQKAGERRIAEKDRKFLSHYDLASYLMDRALPMLNKKVPDGRIGRMDELYKLLENLNFNTPKKIDDYLSSIGDDFENRPLAQQIIDLILGADSKKYEIYNKVRDVTTPDQTEPAQEKRLPSGAIVPLLHHWIAFERSVRKLARLRKYGTRTFWPTYKLLRQLEVFDENELEELNRIRRVRNDIVHNLVYPSNNDISLFMDKLGVFSKKIEHCIKDINLEDD